MYKHNFTNACQYVIGIRQNSFRRTLSWKDYRDIKQHLVWVSLSCSHLIKKTLSWRRQVGLTCIQSDRETWLYSVACEQSILITGRRGKKERKKAGDRLRPPSTHYKQPVVPFHPHQTELWEAKAKWAITSVVRPVKEFAMYFFSILITCLTFFSS